MKRSSDGVFVPDGIEALRSDIPAIVELIVRTARWVHPDTFRALPVWVPHAARGRALYDASWMHRSTNTRRATGVKAEKFETNGAALRTLVAALDVASPKPKNWTVCHIWGYDDPSFAEQSGVVQDPLYFTCVANMVWLPTPLKGFTDTVPEIKLMLRVCSFHLYGWACEHPSVSAQAEQIRKGWIPQDYPKDWPTGSGEVVLPTGTAPFTPNINRKIAARKSEIRAALTSSALPHYPRRDVERVLEKWKIELG